MTASQPEFEIWGNYIYKFMSVSRPVFEIRDGRYVHEYMMTTRAVYELRRGPDPGLAQTSRPARSRAGPSRERGLPEA
jgi:hypothetical protein